jgi:anti-sigma regulatory factor (Ser/Thr protein kinase)
MAVDRRERIAAFGRAGATIPTGPMAPAAAREYLTRWLEDHVSETDLDDALLLVSELVTNSVRHAGTLVGAPLSITAELTGDVLRLEVGDTGRRGRVARRAPHPHGGGFGLNIVDGLAARWGVEHRGGTQVWCELLRQPLPG